MASDLIAAGLVVFRRNESNLEYLMLQTSYGEHHWTPPKGHVDFEDEDPLSTAYRETLEEAGLKKDDLKLYDSTRKMLKYHVRGRKKTVIYWLAELTNDAAIKLSDEHQDYKWLPLSAAIEIGKYKDLGNLLKCYDKMIRQESGMEIEDSIHEEICMEQTSSEMLAQEKEQEALEKAQKEEQEAKEKASEEMRSKYADHGKLREIYSMAEDMIQHLTPSMQDQIIREAAVRLDEIAKEQEKSKRYS